MVLKRIRKLVQISKIVLLTSPPHKVQGSDVTVWLRGGVKVYLVTRLKDWGWGLSLVVIQHQLVDDRLHFF